MTTEQSNLKSGYLVMLLCCITNAISFVFISDLNQTHNQLLSIVIIFGYATIIFNLLNFKRIKNLYSLVAKNLQLFSRMNLITLISWGSSFLALNYLDPATTICIMLSICAITIFFIVTPLSKLNENKHLILSILLILISMGLIIKQHADTTIHSTLKTIIIGVFWCITGGISSTLVGTHSEKMGQAGFSITQILATRFYLLIIFCGIALFLTEPISSLVIDWKYYLFSSFIIVFFPLIMFQIAIKSLGTLIVSLLEPLTPVITYFLQVLSTKEYQFNFLTFLLLTITSGLLIWLVRIEQHAVRTRRLLIAEVGTDLIV